MNALQRLDGRKISRVAGLVVHDSLVCEFGCHLKLYLLSSVDSNRTVSKREISLTFEFWTW